LKLIQNGYVIRQVGDVYQMLQIVNGRVVAELEPTPAQKKKFKHGLYDLEFNYLGTQEDFDTGRLVIPETKGTRASPARRITTTGNEE
jgi:hypothetical protein